MKIICIGRNYSEHIQELHSTIPKDPVFFCKPDTALLLHNRPFYLPDFSKEIHYETELIIKIDRVGKNIEPKFASSYYNSIGLGFDFTARDIQRKCTKDGLPWEICKGFDHSAAIGEFVPKTEFTDVNHLAFHLLKNGELVQKGNSEDMLFNIDELISYVSRFMTLQMGDILFTGTPTGVGPLKIGDHLEAFLENSSLLKCEIK
ncbi:MAG: fumarylacetoacetate hydrolase family protein [Bacteroidales bacterium]